MEEETFEEPPIFLEDTLLVGSNKKLFIVGDMISDSGLMGQVFNALDENGNDVAIKALKPELMRGSYDNFMRQANMLGGMDHNNIVGLIDGPFAHPHPFYVMEFVPQTLEDIPVSDHLFRKVMTGMSRFIKYMHLVQKQIYGDIKTTNVGFNGEVKMLDMWGLPIGQVGEDETMYTTGECAPPEYLENNRNIFPAMDIYMAGMALGDYLMGQIVKDTVELIPNVENAFNVHLPSSLKTIFKRTLHDDPMVRPDAMELGKMVKGYIKETKNLSIFGNATKDDSQYRPIMER